MPAFKSEFSLSVQLDDKIVSALPVAHGFFNTLSKRYVLGVPVKAHLPLSNCSHDWIENVSWQMPFLIPTAGVFDIRTASPPSVREIQHIKLEIWKHTWAVPKREPTRGKTIVDILADVAIFAVEQLWERLRERWKFKNYDKTFVYSRKKAPLIIGKLK